MPGTPGYEKPACASSSARRQRERSRIPREAALRRRARDRPHRVPPQHDRAEEGRDQARLQRAARQREGARYAAEAARQNRAVRAGDGSAAGSGTRRIFDICWKSHTRIGSAACRIRSDHTGVPREASSVRGSGRQHDHIARLRRHRDAAHFSFGAAELHRDLARVNAERLVAVAGSGGTGAPRCATPPCHWFRVNSSSNASRGCFFHYTGINQQRPARMVQEMRNDVHSAAATASPKALVPSRRRDRRCAFRRWPAPCPLRGRWLFRLREAESFLFPAIRAASPPTG